MTVKMSSEGETAKSALSEGAEKGGADQSDSSQDAKDAKASGENNVDKTEEDAVDGKEKKVKEDGKDVEDSKPDGDGEEDKVKKEEKVKKDEKDEKSEESDKEEDGDDSEKEEEKEVPKVEAEVAEAVKKDSGSEAKSSELDVDNVEVTKVDFEKGRGTALGDIPRIDASISRFKKDDLKLLHKVLFKVVAKNNMILKNIRKFNGFEFKKDSEGYNKKVAALQKFELKHLKSVCEMLELTKSGSKDEIVSRILEFLLEPKDSGKVGGGRPKRTAAVKANNRGYSSHDDYSSDEKRASRGRDKGKRSNLKDDSSSESDEDFQPSEENSESEKPRQTKRRGGRRKAASDDDISDVTPSTDESDEEFGVKKKNARNSTNKGRGRGTPGRRGRKPGPGRRPGRGRKRKEESSEDEESDQKDEGSSSEDEPLAKKAKGKEPPTDEEIKSYVKKILEEANWEEITMKTVCLQVFDHFPDFDLTHKKDFIKTTVKSIIST